MPYNKNSTKSAWFWYYSYFAEILLAVVADVMDGNDYLCGRKRLTNIYYGREQNDFTRGIGTTDA